MNHPRSSILVIDHQTYWLERVAEALQGAGYQISTAKTYAEALKRTKGGTSWDIVVLGCASIGYKERMLVASLVERDQSVIILSATLTVQDMRDLFLQGVKDVTDKTYHSAEILTIIEQTQERIAKRNRPWKLAGREFFYEKTRAYPRC
ncbi:MAG TPA: hypothetical protein VFV38_36905 [Ktedonobacteraceae bacterium]|nr:hypothetical protein [Ktedonobacteraceae bacterium]